MNLVYGILLILIGCVVTFDTYKNPNKREFYEGINAPDFMGYGLGILLIAIGISMLLKS